MVRIASVVLVVLAAVALVAVNPLGAQKIGDPAPTFSNLPGVDGKNHSLSEYKKDVVVICITCNHCPIAVLYEKRLIDFNKKFGSKVDFVAINVNNNEQDKLPQMIERAKKEGFNFPYLYDETQAIARSLNAKVTPHFFVLNKKRELVYSGAMDDSNNAANVKTRYLEAACTSALAGQTPETTTTTVTGRGCGIQYQKKTSK